MTAKKAAGPHFLPKWHGICSLKFCIDNADTYGRLKETMFGDSHNDIKRGYLKCWSSMAEANIVFPNPPDLD